MYTIKRTKLFEKSFKRLKKTGIIKPVVERNLATAIDCLANGVKLEAKFKDHFLKGHFEGYRECHIQGDLLLIYKIEEQQLLLVLVDIGSHSYLFG